MQTSGLAFPCRVEGLPSGRGRGPFGPDPLDEEA